MTLRSNPASRLLTILSRFFVAGQSNPGTNSAVLWIQAIGPNLSLIEAIAEVNRLVQDVAARIEADPGILKKDRYLAWRQPLVDAFSPVCLARTAGETLGAFDPNGRIAHTLEFVSEALSRSFGEEDLNDTDKQEVSDAAEELRNAVLDEIDDPLLRTSLLELVEGIRRSIALFEIRGPQGLRDAVDQLIAILTIHRKQMTSRREQIVRTLKSIYRVLTVTTKVVRTLGLLPMAFDLLDDAKGLLPDQSNLQQLDT